MINVLTLFFYRSVKKLNENGPFICDHCGLRSSSRHSFLAHTIYCYRRDKIRYHCDLCPRSFYQKRNLIVHMKTIHLNILLFECKVCGHKSSRRTDLTKHMLQHEPKTECQVCHKLVTDIKTHLTFHVKVQCMTCNKFLSRNHISKHIKLHEKGRFNK